MATYEDLDAQLQEKHYWRRKVAGNTYAVRDTLHSIQIVLYETPILTFHTTGEITVTSGGFRTKTTYERIASFLPHGIPLWQKRNRWYVAGYRFFDGMQVKREGQEVILLNPDTRVGERDHVDEIVEKHVHKLIKTLTAERLSELAYQYEEGCTACEDGDLSRDHLLTHLDNQTLTPWLLTEAYNRYSHARDPLSKKQFDETYHLVTPARKYIKRLFLNELYLGVTQVY